MMAFLMEKMESLNAEGPNAMATKAKLIYYFLIWEFGVREGHCYRHFGLDYWFLTRKY
jgi:hypothetical protein